MALIEITVDRPSLISTGEGAEESTDEDGGVLPGDEDDQHEPAESATTDDGLGDTLKTVSTILTAVTTIAGVLKRLRSEDADESGSAVDVAEELFEDEESDGEDEVEAFEDELVEQDNEDPASETEVDADSEADAEDSGRGLGLTVAFVLVVILIALAIRSRGGDESDEDALDDDWD